MRDQGASLAQIAYALREMGTTPPSGRAWTVKTIETMLDDKVAQVGGRLARIDRRNLER
jgi:hypothetical protein